MTVAIACNSCARPFDALEHAGLVRCGTCEERSAPRMPSAGLSVIVLDTPGEAWA
jgi:hypothetical protein